MKMMQQQNQKMLESQSLLLQQEQAKSIAFFDSHAEIHTKVTPSVF